MFENGANVFDIVLGSDGNKQGTQYNKRRCILDLSHSPLFRLIMATENIQYEEQPIHFRIRLLERKYM